MARSGSKTIYIFGYLILSGSGKQSDEHQGGPWNWHELRDEARDHAIWAEALSRLEWPLRVKGIVNVEGEDNPRVIHGVQHIFFPTTTLERWPDDKRETQLVFIVRDMNSQFIAQTLSNFVSAAKGTPDARVVH